MRSARQLFILVTLMSLTAMQLLVEEARAIQAESALAADQARIELAREDINEFIEYCSGLTQASVHRRLQSQWSDHSHSVSLFPIEHGKTVQTTWKMVWLMGKYPDRAGAYVSSGEKPAKKTIRAVRRIIENNEKVHRVFPDLAPELERDSTAKTCWSSLELRVKGAPDDGAERDPTLAGYGWEGQISGSRLHWIFIDNVCNKKNTMSSNMRESVLESIEDDILSRLLDGGECHITDTSWYDDDPPHVLGSREGWHIQIEDAEKGDVEGETLWPAQWPWRRLEAKKKRIGKMSYDRTLRNITTSKSRGTFKDEFIKPYIGLVPWEERVVWTADEDDEYIKVVTGVDLATGPGESHDDTVFQTGIREGNQYRLLNTWSGKIEGNDILRELIRIFRAFHTGANHTEFRVESNAAQQYIISMAKDAVVMGALGMTDEEHSRLFVVPHNTTSLTKRDLEYGIPSLASDLQMKRWMFPDHHEVEYLRNEMLSWSPESHTGDRLQALFLMREGLRPEVDGDEGYGYGELEAASL